MRCVDCLKDDQNTIFQTREHVIPRSLERFELINPTIKGDVVCDVSNKLFSPLEGPDLADILMGEAVDCDYLPLKNDEKYGLWYSLYMADLKIDVHETMTVSEHIRAETELDASMYLNEFRRHEQEYLKTSAESELVFAFLNLQIYLECFFHQNMRRVVTLEFKSPRDNKLQEWDDNEYDYVRKKLVRFVDDFFVPIPAPITQLSQDIKDNLKKIDKIRNLFAHGHKVAAWSDSDGNAGTTPAKDFLSVAQLNQSKRDVNAAGAAWNDLLDAILPQCNALARVNDFKFKSL